MADVAFCRHYSHGVMTTAAHLVYTENRGRCKTPFGEAGKNKIRVSKSRACSLSNGHDEFIYLRHCARSLRILSGSPIKLFKLSSEFSAAIAITVG